MVVGYERTVGCPECERDGVRSTVREHTALALTRIKTFRDDEGRVHVHEPRKVRTAYECSRGHQFQLEETVACPTCGWRGAD